MNDKSKMPFRFPDVHKDILNIVFPRHCPICDSVMKNDELICPECMGIPRRVRPPYCIKCGKHISASGTMICYDCGRMERFFDGGFSLYEYASVKDSVYAFKNRGRPEYSVFFGREIVRYLGEELSELNAEAIIPVPLHPSRQRMRGYNQSALLSKEISDRLHIPVREELLVRRRKTPPQKKMSLEERQNNLKKAFHMSKNDVKLKSIIMVDDVFTTGNTMNAVSRVLKEAGVERIYALTLAIGSGFSGE